MLPRKLLALDFDGVICDSRLETFIVSLRTYGHLSPKAVLAKQAAVENLLEKPYLQALKSDPVYLEFQRLAPFGNRAEDFGVALNAIEKNEKISNQTEYDRFYETCDQSWRNAFHTQLYRQRNALRTAQPTAWANLHYLYHPLIKALRKHQADWVYAIATAKDRRSVDFLLNHWQISDLFHPELIADKETGTHKTSHLTYLQVLTSMDFDAITFMDDKANHLIKVAPLGVRCLLAGWGTDSQQEAETAMRSRFSVVQLRDIEQVVFLQTALIGEDLKTKLS